MAGEEMAATKLRGENPYLLGGWSLFLICPLVVSLSWFLDPAMPWFAAGPCRALFVPTVLAVLINWTYFGVIVLESSVGPVRRRTGVRRGIALVAGDRLAVDELLLELYNLPEPEEKPAEQHETELGVPQPSARGERDFPELDDILNMIDEEIAADKAARRSGSPSRRETAVGV